MPGGLGQHDLPGCLPLNKMAGGMSLLNIDLTINARWAQVEDALQNLKASLPVRAAPRSRRSKA
jgi:hypothetical protein